MNFKHQYFYLDQKLRKVFDENNKELYLTDNAFRVLVFLCDNKSATVTEIGDFLDRVKDYDENHIRQYRYKINTIIGHEVIQYKNSIYSIVGNTEEVEKSEQTNRITDLLHRVEIKSENKNIIAKKSKTLKFSSIPAIIAIIVLLLTFIDWHSYGYYTIMKFIVTGTMVYYAYYIYEVVKQKGFWFWSSAAIAIIFNPIVPVYLGDKSVWGAVDIIVIGFLVWLLINIRKKSLNVN